MSNEAQVMLDELLTGNRRWRHGLVRVDPDAISPDPPVAALICCSECGTSPEQLFGRAPGELFVIQGAGPRADTSVVSALLWAVESAHVTLGIVLGHTGCAFNRAEHGPVAQLDHYAAPAGSGRSAWLTRRTTRQLAANRQIRHLITAGTLSLVPLILDDETLHIGQA